VSKSTANVSFRGLAGVAPHLPRRAVGLTSTAPDVDVLVVEEHPRFGALGGRAALVGSCWTKSPIGSTLR
jgi:hypothetical protein